MDMNQQFQAMQALISQANLQTSTPVNPLLSSNLMSNPDPNLNILLALYLANRSQPQPYSIPSQPSQIYNANALAENLAIQTQIQQQQAVVSHLLSMGVSQNQSQSVQGMPQLQPQVKVPAPTPISQPHPIPSKPVSITHATTPMAPSSLPTSTNLDNLRKRRHRDVDMLSQPPSKSGSPVNNTEKTARSRAFTCPETMKPKDMFPKPSPSSIIDKTAKLDSSVKADTDKMLAERALILEKLHASYVLNMIGESAYRQSDPDRKPDENDDEMETIDADGNVVKEKCLKIPLSEIHRLIEDSFESV